MLTFERVKWNPVVSSLIIVLGFTDLQEWFTFFLKMDIQIALLIVNLETEEIMKRSNERSEINGQNYKCKR